MTETTNTQQYYLIVTTGKDWCDILHLREDEVVSIVRSGSNDIVVPDDKCSRKHSVIRFRRGKWVIQDLGSTNGTYLNGEPVQVRASLTPTDSILVASTEIKFTDKIGEEGDSLEVDVQRDPDEALENTVAFSANNDSTDLPLESRSDQ